MFYISQGPSRKKGPTQFRKIQRIFIFKELFTMCGQGIEEPQKKVQEPMTEYSINQGLKG